MQALLRSVLHSINFPRARFPFERDPDARVAVGESDNGAVLTTGFDTVKLFSQLSPHSCGHVLEDDEAAKFCAKPSNDFRTLPASPVLLLRCVIAFAGAHAQIRARVDAQGDGAKAPIARIVRRVVT